MFQRSGGILLHPTSLAGPYGIGDFGPAALDWIDWLVEAGCRLWQVLPLGPTGYGDSPYQSFSSFAGNFLLISLDRLVEEGLLSSQDLDPRPDCPPSCVDYSIVMDYKERLLTLAMDNYHKGAAHHLEDDFASFCQTQSTWLDDFALFMALKKAHQGVSWTAWEQQLVRRQPEALVRAVEQWVEEIEAQKFRQFLFFRQWSAVRQRATAAGITIIGDIPIFAAHDSADVWANPEVFQLAEEGAVPVGVGELAPVAQGGVEVVEEDDARPVEPEEARITHADVRLPRLIRDIGEDPGPVVVDPVASEVRLRLVSRVARVAVVVEEDQLVRVARLEPREERDISRGAPRDRIGRALPSTHGVGSADSGIATTRRDPSHRFRNRWPCGLASRGRSSCQEAMLPWCGAIRSSRPRF